MWSALSSIFGGGAVKAIENIALEAITTEKESAEAKALMVKTLDPNGLMRRDISKKVSNAYIIYLFTVMGLVIAKSFDVGNIEQVSSAIDSLASLFSPITSMFMAIVTASFGVNATNNIKEWKMARKEALNEK